MIPSAANKAGTALCLCGGGIAGGMYEVGALTALDDFFAAPGADRSGFTVNDFDVYVGTSAGAFLATALASGISARRLFRAVLKEDRDLLPFRRTDVYRFDFRQGLGVLRDVSRVLVSAMARQARGTLEFSDLWTDLGDVLPAGMFSLRHYEKFLEEFLRRQSLPTRFSEVQKELYITANDLDSGHRVVFGQGKLVDMPIAKAICASSAIPLFFEPVRWAGHDYVDGAVGKVAHADVALARGAELIVVLNPFVPFHNDPDREDLPTPLVGSRHLRDKGLLAVYSQATKMSTRTKLTQSLRRYQVSHPQASLLLIEPREEEGDMFLINPMSFTSRRRMLRYGYESTARLLRERRSIWAAAFERQGIGVDPDRMSPPWELTG